MSVFPSDESAIGGALSAPYNERVAKGRQQDASARRPIHVGWVGPQQHLDAPTEELYRDIRGRGYDAESTLWAMDQEGIDYAVVYRTFAHVLVSIDDLEPGFAIALCRAFNDWLTDYCQADPNRLKPSAIVSLHDPELAAEEARRAVQQKGHLAVVLS